MWYTGSWYKIITYDWPDLPVFLVPWCVPDLSPVTFRLPGTEGEIICADAEDESSTDWHQRQAVLRTVRGTVVYLGDSASEGNTWLECSTLDSTHVNCESYIGEGSLWSETRDV